ncbi:MAG: enoyl-CoA hydratase/isomerase family protein [Alphaproteobacteria bacterium]|nr:enoyl-CoA hydratase/isomerase family protein [Alphaproteobacteria bacterium]
MNEDNPLLVAVADGRATITLNRPALHNRLDGADLARLGAVLGEIDGDPEVRVIVLTGTGKSFCSGYDLGSLAKGADRPVRERFSFATLVDRLEAMRAPTIAALNGGVYGGGTDLGLACDFRIGVAGARMMMPAGQIGLHYYAGGIRRYVTRMGPGAAKRLFLLGETLDATEMLRIGYLDEIVPDLDALKARVDTIADLIAGAPSAEVIQGMKRAINRVAAADMDPTEADAASAASRRSPVVAAAVAARLARRRR